MSSTASQTLLGLIHRTAKIYLTLSRNTATMYVELSAESNCDHTIKGKDAV